MQSKLLFRLVLLLIPVGVFGQASYLRLDSKYYGLLDRLEIKTRSAELTQSFVKPYNRKWAVIAANNIYKDTALSNKLTPIDKYNLTSFLSNHPKWSGLNAGSFMSTGNLITANSKDFFMLVNPVARYQYSKEKGNTKNPMVASVGIDVRGLIANKVGFDLYFTANQERLPVYMNNWLIRYSTVPGVGNFTLRPNKTVRYYDVRGSVQTSVGKYIELQLGYDKNFFGNGYRSLFLSNIGASTAFFKINTRIWKLNFQSLYMKLTPQYGIVNQSATKKYLRINTLGIDVAKWLNVSFFDAVVLGRSNGFDLNYILPITFLRAMEQQSGSPDNALVGMNIKSNLAGKFQLYGQFLLDEFKVGELTAGKGWWANKFGYQLGAKYIDAFGVNNLDLQVETNRVRPFTYSHFDSISNYSHFNQPLAHPLGANFHEFIGIMKYQALKRLYLQGKIVYYTQGLDSLGVNSGNNVLIDYKKRPGDYGWKVGSGDKATCLYLSGLVSYELLENLFVDASFIHRNFKTELGYNLTTTMLSVGFRWNIARREFDY